MDTRKFHHDFFDRIEITNIDDPDRGRYYITPDGEFSSVTTIIGKKLDNSWLQEWKERVGADEAEKQGTRARIRGSLYHNALERYLCNDPCFIDDEVPTTVDGIRRVLPILNRHVGTIYGIEYPLYSSFLKTAGRTDLLCDWDGVRTVVDFKTSKNAKEEEDILGYLIQGSAYGIMMNERIGDPSSCFGQMVIIIMVDNQEPQTFKKPIIDYARQTLKVFRG